MAIIWQQGTRTVLKLTRCLSTLRLHNAPGRLLIHFSFFREYDHISALIENRPRSKDGSVIVSGQPGTGEVLQLPPYLTGSNQLADIKGKTAYLHLRVIHDMIKGCPFLFQAKDRTVYLY